MSAADLLDALATGRVGDVHAMALAQLEAGLESPDLGRSLANCHMAGLDSVVLADQSASGAGMVRFFHARHGVHRLGELYGPAGHFTLGVHNHRYALAIIPLTGTIANVETKLRDCQEPSRCGHRSELHEYAFTSALADDDAGPVRVAHRAIRCATTLEQRTLTVGQAHLMSAADLHTVLVPPGPGPGTAWLVIEGPEAGSPASIYSPRPGLSISSEELYLPMSGRRASDITVGVLARGLSG